MLSPGPCRLLIDATCAARRATCLLSHTTRVDSKRQEAALGAVEQLWWLQQTQRPLKRRLWRAAVQRLEQNVTALRASTHFPHLLAAAVVLSQQRPLGHESVLLQILLHHVLERPADAAAAVGLPIDEDHPTAASRIAAAAAEGSGDVAAGGAAQTTQLTDQQFLQLLLCWDRAAALRPSLETLARPLLRSLLWRASQRSRQSQEELTQEEAVRVRAGAVPADTQAADLQFSSSTGSCCSSGDSGAAMVFSQDACSTEKRCRVVNSQALLSGRRILASHESGGTAAPVSSEQAAAAAHLSEDLQLLNFLGRHLDELLLLEQEHAAAAALKEKPITEVKQQAVCSPAQVNGTSRASANTSKITAAGANYDSALNVEGCSSGSDGSRDEEATERLRVQKPLRTSTLKEVLRRCPVRPDAEAETQDVPAAAASAEHSNIAWATWRLLLHCFDAWQKYCKRFGWTQDQAAAVLPQLAFSGARVLLALLQHLQTVGTQREHIEQRENDAWVYPGSERRQQQPHLRKHLGCQVLQHECHLQQPSSCAVQLRTTGAETAPSQDGVAKFLVPPSHCRRRWGGCSTSATVCSLEDRRRIFFQVHDLQQQAAKLQRQLLQLPLQSLSHSQALVQVPAAAFLLRLLHYVSLYVHPQHSDKNRLQEKSGVQRRVLPHAEANEGRQQQQTQEQGDSTKEVQKAWRRLSLSVDRHIRKERGRRDAMALQLEDVCDCFNAMLRCRWIPIRSLGRWLRAACNRTDSLSLEQRTDLETAFSRLSGVMEKIHRFIQEPAAIDLNNGAFTPRNRRCGGHERDIQSSGSSGLCCWRDCAGTNAVRISRILRAQSSGKVRETVESGESLGNRRGVFLGTHPFEDGDRLQKNDRRAESVHAHPPALMCKDDNNCFWSMGSGWVAADEAVDKFEDRSVQFCTDKRKESTRQETNGQTPQRVELTMLLDFINHVKVQKILQRRHRSMISWKCGRKDARTF